MKLYKSVFTFQPLNNITELTLDHSGDVTEITAYQDKQTSNFQLVLNTDSWSFSSIGKTLNINDLESDVAHQVRQVTNSKNKSFDLARIDNTFLRFSLPLLRAPVHYRAKLINGIYECERNPYKEIRLRCGGHLNSLYVKNHEFKIRVNGKFMSSKSFKGYFPIFIDLNREPNVFLVFDTYINEPIAVEVYYTWDITWALPTYPFVEMQNSMPK